MASIYVYNNNTNRMERFERGEAQPMPYSMARTLLVNEFRGSSIGSVLWTDRRTMQAWNSFRSYYGSPVYVGFAFKRIWEGGHSNMSQHYAGNAFDCGQNLGASGRARLRAAAVNSGAWSYVEPAWLTPGWVHVDRRFGAPACAAGGYPLLRQGSRGVYVLTMQDALNALGFASGLDGVFGPITRGALQRFQAAFGLAADGVCGCLSWTALTAAANGIGRTSTVIGG